MKIRSYRATYIFRALNGQDDEWITAGWADFERMS
jgi:hypothetical protein